MSSVFSFVGNAARVAASVVVVVAVSTAHAQPQELVKLLPTDGAPDADFGYSVAVSGATAVVGAPGRWDCGPFAGSAYLFDTTTGQQIAKLLRHDCRGGEQFGWSVAISDGTAIVGALQGVGNRRQTGSAYLYDTSDGREIAKLLPDDAADLDRFGCSVAISGATAIVGAYYDDDNGDASGSAYLFDATTGAQIAKLLPNDGAENDLFGFSVAISGDTAIVGSRGDDENGWASGSVYLFDTTTGQQIAKLLPSDGSQQDSFGVSVAISGDTAVVGAPNDDDNGNQSGSAYLFDTTTGQQIAKLLPSDGIEDGDYGRSVAISGAMAVVGAAWHGDNGFASGSAYLFDTTTGLQIAKLLPNDGADGDLFGISVAISDTATVVGAHWDDDNGINSGSAYVFDVSPPCRVDLNGDGIVNSQDFLAFLGAWSAGDPLADWDGNGVIDTRDFLAYLTAWSAGCP